MPDLDDVLGAGVSIIESKFLAEQFRFPRTRKRRIRNKWRNREENWRPNMKAVMLGNSLVCHPAFAQKLRQQFENDN